MAFSIVNQQIRLRFSKTAEEVIAYDMDVFEETSRSTFINRILSNFYENANASIGRKLQIYKEELLSVSGCNEESAVYKELMGRKKKQLIEKAGSFENPEKNSGSSPIRLWDDFFEYLIDPGSNNEDKYYLSIPKYCRAIIEEYARLPFTERELVFFNKEIVSPITDAITNGYQIYVSTGIRNDSGTLSSYFFIPFEITTDPLSTANYVVGYSYKADQSKRDKRMCSFKLSRIVKVKRESSRSAFLSKDDISCLQEAINQKGVMFLVADASEEIVVRLTDNGKRMFKTQIHMRPMASKINGDIYTFSCSAFQAKNYFFKFGKEAEILSPPFLRQQFADEYEAANRIYEK